MTHDDRRTSLVVAVVGAVVFVALAVALVPWDPVPGPTGTVPTPDTVFSADQIAAAEAFSREARVWSWSSMAVSLAVACWLGFSRLGRRLAGSVPGPWWVRVVLIVAALALLGRLATLPFALLLHGHLVEYGLSTQTRPEFLLDLAKAEAVGIVVTALAVLVVVGCARRWRRAWPAIAGGVLAGFVLVGSLVYPVLIEPIFNDFEPLPDGEFRSQILALADEEGVDVQEVLVADASRRTTTLNAYVSGLGTTRRVVVYDNLVEDLPRGPGALRGRPRAGPCPAPGRADRVPAGGGRSAVRRGPARAGGRYPARAAHVRSGGGSPRAGPGGARRLRVHSGAEHRQPPDRDPGGRGRAPGDG